MPFRTIDLRPGGVFFHCMRSPEGRDFWGKGVFREIVVPERIVLADSFADAEGNVVPPTHYGMGPASRRARMATWPSRAGPKPWIVSPDTWQRRESPRPRSTRREDGSVVREQERRGPSSGRVGRRRRSSSAREGAEVFLALLTRGPLGTVAADVAVADKYAGTKTDDT